MLKIAFIVARVPYPLNAGNRIRTFNLLREISRVHRVSLITAVESQEERDALAALGGQVPFAAVHAAQVPRRNTPLRRVLRLLRNTVDPLPYTWAAYRHPRVAETLARAFRETEFDLVHCDSIQVAHTLAGSPRVARLLNAHNVEHVIVQRVGECAPALKKLPVAWQAAKTRRAEQRTFQLFDGCAAVSELDGALIRRLAPHLRITVVPNGVDTEWFTPRREPTGAPVLLFTGALDWLPNVDAVQFFVADVLPRIRARLPNVQFKVVGRNPAPSLASRFASGGVHLVGPVQDVRPFMAQADVFVVPLRIGGGTRLKILEAWAMGKAVLSTSVGAEGLPGRDNANIALEDRPQAFADRAVALLGDTCTADRLGDAGRRTVEQGFSWKRIASGLLDAYRATVEAHAAPRVSAALPRGR